jgi:thioesterase DpgC
MLVSTSAYSHDARLQRWLADAFASTDAPQRDAAALEVLLADGERLLAELPARPARTPDEQAFAASVHHAHADWVYDCLTDNRTVRLALAQLAARAACDFPGLVPDAATLESERNCLQADKEQREIDQGIFFAAILASPQSGEHLIDSMLQPCARALELSAAFRASGRLRLDKVLLERRGDVAHLTFHNEDSLNAEDGVLIADMETAVDLALLDPAVRVSVLRGSVMHHPKYAGRRVFSAGINLRELHRGQIPLVDFLLQREMGYIHKMLRGLRSAPSAHGEPDTVLSKPWIAAVDSFAIGGGAQLLLVCDYVIGAANSYFSLPAAQEGIVPGLANLRLTRATGSRMARQIILDGRRVEAAEPDGRLLFDEVVAPDAMDAAIALAAARLSAPAVIANRNMLALAEEPPGALRAYLSAFAREQALRMYSADVLDKVARH